MSYNEKSGGFLSAVCPDKQCHSKLYFASVDTVVECNHCGQRHDRNALHNVQEVSDFDAGLNDMLRNILMSNIIPKRTPENVKVLGLSNYHCKLLSPLLTNYGMDKTGKAKLLTEMNQGDIFDCGLFGDRAFLIDEEHIHVVGFGRDVTGSMLYLSKTLDVIKAYNAGEERLLPIHADGDGHCLVHAVSRALVGRELFWHPLRCSLKKHFEDSLDTYKDLFKDFVDESEWTHIIAECDPDFVPPEGELLGLRNIHVFGLANVLKRPIILLDSLECMQSLGDYAALFLPSLIPPDLCHGKDQQLNKPLCIAWSSSGHNHYIPLVGIKKKPLPILPSSMLPKVWGVPQSQISNYMEFENDGSVTIGGNRSLGDPYILRLVTAMEELFFEKYGVHPSLVADVHHYLYQSTGVVLGERVMVIQKAKKAVDEGRLYRCLNCNAICEQVIKPQWFRAGGVLYNMALMEYRRFIPNKIYPFPLHGIVCRYNAATNELQPDLALSCLVTCTWCNGGFLRKVRADGTIMYRNEDRTKTPAVNSTCNCGYKHFWCGKEYDNPPKKLIVTLEWNGKVVKDTVVWFENESDPSLNSNVYQVASEVVQKHFPGEFGSERLVQRVVQQILNQTRQPEPAAGILVQTGSSSNDLKSSMKSSKLIIGGKGILHKEDLGLSETEKMVLSRVQAHAADQQKRQTDEAVGKTYKIVAKEAKMVSFEIPEKCDPAVPKSSLEYPRRKFVKVVTSDGRQGKLCINKEGVTYNDLQNWVFNEFQIPTDCQRIKFGFPLQVLRPPKEGEESKVLPLSHGDRVVIEKVVAPSEEVELSSAKEEPMPPPPPPVPKAETQNSVNTSEHWESQLDSLSASDPLETQALILSISARLSNQTVWNYAKKRPHLFRPAGLFYEQASRDIGLRDDHHFRLETFAEKIFVYNAKADCIELCVKPHGHFTIREGMETDIIKALDPNSEKPHCSLTIKSALKKDTVTSGPSTGSKIPRTELEPLVHYSKSNSITTESTNTNIPKHTLIRKGPGYSVLSPVEPTPAFQINQLKNIASKLSKSMETSNTDRMMPNSANQNAEDSDEADAYHMDDNVDSPEHCEDNGSIVPTENHVSMNETVNDSTDLEFSDDKNEQTAKESTLDTIGDSDIPNNSKQCDISKSRNMDDSDIKTMDVDCV